MIYVLARFVTINEFQQKWMPYLCQLGLAGQCCVFNYHFWKYFLWSSIGRDDEEALQIKNPNYFSRTLFGRFFAWHGYCFIEQPITTFRSLAQNGAFGLMKCIFTAMPRGQPCLTIHPCSFVLSIPIIHSSSKIHNSLNLTPKIMEFFAS